MASNHWQTVPLRDCCRRPEYGFTGTASKNAEGIKYLRITDIQERGVDWNAVPSIELPRTKRDYFLKPGDIVIARIGATTGKAFLIRSCPRAVFASYLIRIRSKRGLLPTYLHLCLQTQAYWNHIRKQKGGRLKKGVNISVLENFCIPLPTTGEQRTIVRLFRSIARARDSRLQETRLLDELFASSLEELMTGQFSTVKLIEEHQPQ